MLRRGVGSPDPDPGHADGSAFRGPLGGARVFGRTAGEGEEIPFPPRDGVGGNLDGEDGREIRALERSYGRYLHAAPSPVPRFSSAAEAIR